MEINKENSEILDTIIKNSKRIIDVENQKMEPTVSEQKILENTVKKLTGFREEGVLLKSDLKHNIGTLKDVVDKSKEIFEKSEKYKNPMRILDISQRDTDTLDEAELHAQLMSIKSRVIGIAKEIDVICGNMINSPTFETVSLNKK